ncbi:MAG TPA: SMI1/KNR4 family protein [Verrucomicrobiae bacterium]|nr:SMI1/KNR4 family protein [Verrucomicrobiae bacterium]
MSSFVEQALELAGNCNYQERPTEQHWLKVEAELGVKLPSEYKALVSRFGTGRFGGDLYVFNPAASKHIRLSKKDLEDLRQEYAAFLDWLAQDGYRLYPEPGGIIITAATTSQISFGFQTKDCPVSDLIVVRFGAHECERLQMGLAEFICRLYRGELYGVGGLRTVIWNGSSDRFFTPFATFNGDVEV